MIKLINSIFIFLLSTTLAFAQTASILPPGKTTFFDDNGKPLAGGKVQFYIPGTTTNKTTWQDAGQTIPNTNPVVLDSAGRAIIYGNGSYQQVVRDKNNNLIWNVQTASGGSGGGGTTPTVGDGQPVGSVQSWAGFSAPSQYAFAYGQEFTRSGYPELFAALTLQQNVSCTLGNPTLTGVGNTEQLIVGARIESTCLNPGSTIVSKTTSTVTASANAIISTTSSARFFNYGNGDGSLTFNVPDYRGKTLVGRCNMGGISCTNLTATYYGANPNGVGASGGSESQILTQAQLPATPLAVNVSGNVSGSVTSVGPAVLASPVVINYQGGGASATVAGASGPIASSGTMSGSMTGATANMGSNAPSSKVQPSQTANLIIKITPDTNPNSFFGVASIGGMQGVILCGQGVTCAGNTISALVAALQPPKPTELGGIFQSNAPANQFAVGVDLSGNLLYAPGATTVNGQVCAIGGTCTISASAGTITVGTTSIASGTSNGLLFNNGAVLGNTNTANNGVVVTNGSGVPSVGTTNIITNTHLAQGAPATIKGNPTASTANEQDFTIQGLLNKPSPDANNDRLVLYDASTGTLKNCTVGQCGSVGSTGVVSYNGITGAVVAPSSDKTIYLSTSGNDANNGLSPESAKLTPQAAIDAANGGGVVFAGAGTYQIASSLLWRANVKMMCSPGTVITQVNNANLGRVVDFATNSANGGSAVGCTFDGNRANSIEGSGVLIYVGTANDVTFDNNTITGASGNAVIISTGVRPRFTNNIIANVNLYGIIVLTGVAQTQTQGYFNSNRFMAPQGIHPFGIVNSNGNIFSQNKVFGTQVGSPAAPTRISSSGSTITWVSGPNFADIFPGMFIVLNNGSEFFISGKTSNTSLTTSTPIGSNTNVPAILGTGDLVSVENSGGNILSENFITGGVTGGFVLFNGTGGQDSRQNSIINNQLINIGECAICITPINNATVISDTKITGNTIVNSAQTYAPVGPGGVFDAALTITGANVGKTYVSDNYITDDQSSKTIYSWMALSAINPGQIIIGKNAITGPVNGNSIFGGIIGTPSLSGWGAGASVSAIVSNGASMTFTITSGTGPSTNPTVTVSTAASGVDTIGNVKTYANATGLPQPIIGDLSMAAGSKTFTFVGTPAASSAYTVYAFSN